MHDCNIKEFSRAVVLSRPQIGFPFPGEPEVNIICRIKNGGMNELVAVAIYNAQIPEVNSEIEVVKMGHYYLEKEEAYVRWAYPAPGLLKQLHEDAGF